VSEEARMWIEIVFNIGYLVAVWSLVVLMRRNQERVEADARGPAELVLWAFALLAAGDTGHVGFRVLAYGLGDIETKIDVFGLQIGLVGLGALATAITVTGFYVLLLFAWRERYQSEFGWFEILLLAATAVRFLIMLFPGNEWNNTVPPQPWSIWRNLPLTALGLGVAYLFIRDARATKDETFLWMGRLILISYACYIPVILFVQRAPAIGMLMIPKTLAYLGIAYVAYHDLFQGKNTARAAVAGGAGDS
jgi:hypothetical protein